MRFTLLAILILCIAACRKTSTEQTSELCPADRSLPARITFKDADGNERVQQFSYDAANRVTSITNAYNTTTLNLRHTPDTIFGETNTQGRVTYSAWCFNRFGEHDFQRTIYLREDGDTSLVTRTTFGYDSLHQLQSSHTSYTDYHDNTATEQRFDSVSFFWNAGNLGYAIEHNAVFPSRRTDYAYLPGTNGPAFPFNAGNIEERVMPDRNQVVPAQLLSSVSSTGGTVRYAYEFDSQGRVSKRTKTSSGPDYSKAADGQYFYTWRCK